MVETERIILDTAATYLFEEAEFEINICYNTQGESLLEILKKAMDTIKC